MIFDVLQVPRPNMAATDAFGRFENYEHDAAKLYFCASRLPFNLELLTEQRLTALLCEAH